LVVEPAGDIKNYFFLFNFFFLFFFRLIKKVLFIPIFCPHHQNADACVLRQRPSAVLGGGGVAQSERRTPTGVGASQSAADRGFGRRR
jgi:hypothetical protein